MEVRIEIVKPGLMTSIQDLGRKGLAYYAIAHSGAMDADSAKIANLLLNKAVDDPVIEVTSIAPTLKFHHSTQIAISGADFEWRLNGTSIIPPVRVAIQAGDIVSGGRAIRGLRGYIAIKGEVDMEAELGSFATQLNAKLGGWKGRTLKKGDVLTWNCREDDSLDEEIFSIFPGPEYTWLDKASRNLLSNGGYKISPHSNRMGMRLLGEPLVCKSHQLEFSAPVLPGFIQLPPNGLPIIVLQDGQTTGGYPRIAYLKLNDLSRLNQVRIGEEIRFTMEE